jgi:hypothetical protein
MLREKLSEAKGRTERKIAEIFMVVNVSRSQNRRNSRFGWRRREEEKILQKVSPKRRVEAFK